MRAQASSNEASSNGFFHWKRKTKPVMSINGRTGRIVSIRQVQNIALKKASVP